MRATSRHSSSAKQVKFASGGPVVSSACASGEGFSDRCSSISSIICHAVSWNGAVHAPSSTVYGCRVVYELTVSLPLTAFMCYKTRQPYTTMHRTLKLGVAD
jgi:hypothetical protein